MAKQSGIVGFLTDTHDKAELAAALKVIRQFKDGEGEYELVPGVAWLKMEQLEEFLDHLVNGSALKDDTLAALERFRNPED